jgi:predicted DNA-binding protein (UPF0251 family)
MDYYVHILITHFINTSSKMARPHKSRCIQHQQGTKAFKPVGIPMSRLKQVVLHLDEMEALRLTNLLDLDQEAAAAQMGVSRATVSRILKSARKKITQALVEGHAVCIEEGAAPLQHLP